MPPKQPTLPATTPITGWYWRRSTIAAWISAIAASPVGFLQAHAAGFQQQHGAGRDALAVVFGRQLQGAGNLRPAHLTELPPWNAPSIAAITRQTAEAALGDHHAVIGLGHHALAAATAT
jgi:hypothetical protein